MLTHKVTFDAGFQMLNILLIHVGGGDDAEISSSGLVFAVVRHMVLAASPSPMERIQAVMLITHDHWLLDYVETGRIQVLANGRIARFGGVELALECEAEADVMAGSMAAC